MSDVNHPERKAVSAPSLNGAWFRHERERIAVGRKPMALRLGTTESKLAMLELRKQDVPQEWLGVLAELGFRMPQGLTSDLSQVSAAEKDTAVAESIDSVPSVEPSIPTENAAGEAVATSSHACMSFADAMRIRSQAATATTKASTLSKSQAVDADTATPSDVSTAETEHQQYQQGEDGTPFSGHWLRERLQKKGIRPRDVVKHLATLPSVLGAIERLNIPLPLEWIPRLLTLGVFTVAESKAVMQLPSMTSSMKNGIWLREQRGKCGLTHSDVATWLGVSRSDLRLVEERQWPLPDEWFPMLTDLFAPSPVIRKNHTAPKNDEAKKDSEPRQRAPQASTTATKAETPAPAPRPANSQSARELIETIMNYRMMLGECSGLSAIEVLAQITADLQFALAKDALSYDQLRAAMKALTAR